MDGRDRVRTTHLPSSSDEDQEPEEPEEVETLIPHNSAADLDLSNDLQSSTSLHFADSIRRGFRSNWKYLVPICLPFLLILVLSFADFHPPYRSVTLPSGYPESPTHELMREAELRALYLLRDQQSALFELWNWLNSSYLDIESSRQSVRSRLWELIKSIDKTYGVLSSSVYGAGRNSSEFGYGNADNGVEICRKVERLRGGRTVEWKPRKGRYLLAICVSGQMSNHLICLQKHILFAAALDRVLIFPSGQFDYRYNRVIDVDGINDCVGRKVVISFSEFAKMKRKQMRVDRFICYMANPPCFVDEGHIKRLKGLGLSLPKLEAAWPENVTSNVRKMRAVDDIKSRFASKDEVLAVGDLFYADVEEDWVMQPGGPVSCRCDALIQPSQLIKRTAERFVQTFLGNNFIALHFRRRDFLESCNEKEESCFFPIPQAAECILQVVEKVDPHVIYLSTDAAESETTLLQSLVVSNNKMIPLIRRLKHASAEKWDALLYRHHLGGDDQVEAMLDRAICAMSTVFIGSKSSTFTEDIIHIRKDWGLASSCDEYLCEGQRPNFIASKE